MKRWYIGISQNGWEYEGSAVITAKSCVRSEKENTVIADGIEIEFDEEIKDPEELTGVI